jgi:hypothetical protein
LPNFIAAGLQKSSRETAPSKIITFGNGEKINSPDAISIPRGLLEQMCTSASWLELVPYKMSLRKSRIFWVGVE